MIPKPILVVLKPLLQDCLKPGTKAHEAGLTVSIEPEKDEKIYFFHMDCDDGKRCLGISKLEQEKCCDYLVFYAKDDDINEVFCFLELKAKDIRRAKLQVINTHERVKALLRGNFSPDQLKNIQWSVYICLSNSAPQETQKVQKELIERFEGRGRVRIKSVVKKDLEFGKFLRQVGQ